MHEEIFASENNHVHNAHSEYKFDSSGVVGVPPAFLFYKHLNPPDSGNGGETGDSGGVECFFGILVLYVIRNMI